MFGSMNSQCEPTCANPAKSNDFNSVILRRLTWGRHIFGKSTDLDQI